MRKLGSVPNFIAEDALTYLLTNQAVFYIVPTCLPAEIEEGKIEVARNLMAAGVAMELMM